MDQRQKLIIECALRILENLPSGDEYNQNPRQIASECAQIIRLAAGFEVGGVKSQS